MASFDIQLYWHNYRYMPYEKELAEREISHLLGGGEFTSSDNGVKFLWKIE